MDDITLALAAGLVAAFNPCGFAMLPSFLAMLVSGPGGVLRALRLSTAITAGFVTVFGAIGFVISIATAPIQQHLPWVTVVTGAILAGLGCWMLSGRELSLPIPASPSEDRPARSSPCTATAPPTPSPRCPARSRRSSP